MDFAITKVVTKNVISDAFQGIRNFFGMRLRGYEDIINKTTDELIKEMHLKYKSVEWYRFSINQLTQASAMITIYGRGETI